MTTCLAIAALLLALLACIQDYRTNRFATQAVKDLLVIQRSQRNVTREIITKLENMTGGILK